MKPSHTEEQEEYNLPQKIADWRNQDFLGRHPGEHLERIASDAKWYGGYADTVRLFELLADESYDAAEELAEDIEESLWQEALVEDAQLDQEELKAELTRLKWDIYLREITPLDRYIDELERLTGTLGYDKSDASYQREVDKVASMIQDAYNEQASDHLEEKLRNGNLDVVRSTLQAYEKLRQDGFNWEDATLEDVYQTLDEAA